MIKFGTSGWRGMIADDFTFENLRKASLGVAKYLKSKNVNKGVVVGYDTRFLSAKFAEEVVLVMATEGIKCDLVGRDCPTPVISAYIIDNKLDAGINITASHNPYRYNGFKFSPSWGGPALPEDTKAIESFINKIDGDVKKKYASIDEVKKAELCSVVDASEDYYKLLEKNIDLRDLSTSGIKVFYDAVYGTGRGYLEDICKKYMIDITTINDNLDPYFNDGGPEPSDANLTKLKDMVKNSGGTSIGIATDGDADRFGIIGSDGNFIEPNKVIALLADYIAKTRKYPKGMGVARSFATGTIIDLVAKHHGLKVYENPVGFKYIGKLISEGKIILGGEESAGLSIMNHVPEKDGIIACLLMVEMLGKEKATTEELFDNFYKRIGRLETKRENYKISEEIKDVFSEKLKEVKDRFLGFEIKEIRKIDGTKIIFKDDSWVLFRESGTEPVVRIYGEAKNGDLLSDIMAKAKEFLFEG